MMQKHITNRTSTASAEVRDLFGGKGLFRRWPYYSEGDGVFPFTIIVETEMEPGAHAGLHTQPGQHELLYILEGSGKFTIEDETHDVVQGDALLAPAGTTFALSNPGDQTLRYLAVKCRTHE